MRERLLKNPQSLGALAAIGATGLGVLTMSAAGAPKAYLIINTAALVIGIALLSLMRRSRPGEALAGWLVLAAAAGLLATALLGLTIDGATRWVRIGVVSLQPSLVLLPAMLMAYARSRQTVTTIAMVVAAVALALQPDRAMAGALLAGLTALAMTMRERQVVLALAAALCGFVVTLLRPDSVLPTAFVEQIYASAFAVSVLAGLALLAGSMLLFLPMLALSRAGALVFAAVWLAILLAAVVGSYPTPLLGYGGSGILGYLLCLAALPGRGRQRTAPSSPARADKRRKFNGHPFATAATASRQLM